MRRKKKSLMKKILNRLVGEAVLGGVFVLLYLHRNLIINPEQARRRSGSWRCFCPVVSAPQPDHGRNQGRGAAQGTERLPSVYGGEIKRS